MTENQRLKILIDKLGFKTQKDFAQKINIQPGSLSDVLRERDGLRVSTAIKDKLSLMFHVNLDWLETGEGQIFLKKGPEISETKEGVPYFDVNLSDTTAESLTLMEDKPEYYVNYKPFNDCTAYLPVYGDSMYPKYASGEIVAVKEITNFDVLQWGEAYVVLTDERANNLRCIKLLHPHEDSSKIILRSSNPNFKGDTVISKKAIQALYIVKGKITRNMI